MFESSNRGYRIHLCIGPNCSARGSSLLLSVLESAVVRHGLASSVEVFAATCRNRCDFGPSLNVYPGPFFYNELTAEAIEEVVVEHLLNHRPVERWLYKPQFLIQNKRKFDP